MYQFVDAWFLTIFLFALFLDIDAESLRVIISVAYCGIFELNRTNVRGVLIAAEYLGIDFLVSECTEFYAKRLEMDNNLFMEIRNLRYTYGHISSLKLAVGKSNKYAKVNISINILYVYKSKFINFRKILRDF